MKMKADLVVKQPDLVVCVIASNQSLKAAAMNELNRLHKIAQIHSFHESDRELHLKNWKILKYAEEYVPHGINYFMKVQIDKDKNLHIRVHRQKHTDNYTFHSLHKTFKGNEETYLWHDNDELTYFEA